jgi:hypothetical protein
MPYAIAYLKRQRKKRRSGLRPLAHRSDTTTPLVWLSLIPVLMFSASYRAHSASSGDYR